MRIYPNFTVDKEFKTLGDLGYTGSLNDRQFSFLRAQGYQNSLADMMGLWKSYSPLDLFSVGEQGAWYDPSDLTTMFQDTAGTTPVTDVGQAVARINDKSGNGNHATQATLANRPTFQIENGCSYLQFDGSNDSLATSSIDFTATDNITVFSGLRKLSDVNRGVFVELSVNTDLNAGTFALTAPNGNGLANLAAYAGGSVRVAGGLATGNAAPVTRVITFAADISADVLSRRQDGINVGTVTSNQGTGNFLSYPLYIGARAGTSLFFNGRLYSLIVRGAQSNNGQISAAEAWVANKTGVTI